MPQIYRKHDLYGHCICVVLEEILDLVFNKLYRKFSLFPLVLDSWVSRWSTLGPHLFSDAFIPSLWAAVRAKSLQLCPTLLRPHRLHPARLYPWNSPGKNAGVGGHFLLQGIFPTQGSSLGLTSPALPGGFFYLWRHLGGPNASQIPSQPQKRL